MRTVRTWCSREVRTIPALLTLFCVLGFLTTAAPTVMAEGAHPLFPDPWPRFGAYIPGSPKEVQWTEAAGSLAGVVLGESRNDGVTTTTATLVSVDRETGVIAERTIYRAQGGPRIGRGELLTHGGHLLVALSVGPGGELDRGIYFYRVRPAELGGGITLGDYQWRRSVAGLRSESDWTILSQGDTPYLVIAGGDAGGGYLEVTPFGSQGEGGVVRTGEFRAGTVAAGARGDDGFVAAWRETDHAGRSTVVVAAGAIAQRAAETGPTSGMVEDWRILARVPFGRGSIIPTGSVNQSRFLGQGVSLADRESMALLVEENRVYLASSEVTRERSQLSEYHTRPVLIALEIDSGEYRRVILVPEEPAAIDSGFQLISRGGDDPEVLLLREYPGEVQSDAFLATPSEVTRNVTGTPRRVAAPAIFGEEGRRILVWLQEDPDRKAWQVGVGSEIWKGIDRARPVVWRGNLAESIAAVVVGLPLSAVLAVYWALVGSFPVLSIVAVAVGLIYRFRPGFARTSPLFVGLFCVMLPAAAAGLPWMSFQGPSPALVHRLLVTVALSGVVLLQSRGESPSRSPAWAIRLSILAAVMVVAGGSYRYALELLSASGLPAML